MEMNPTDRTPNNPSALKRSSSFSAVEIVQNLKALSQAGLMPNPLLISCTDSHHLRAVPHEGVSPHYDANTQTIEFSQSFFNTIKMGNIGFGTDERTIETKVLLIASGVEKTEEKAKLLNVKALYSRTCLKSYPSVDAEIYDFLEVMTLLNFAIDFLTEMWKVGTSRDEVSQSVRSTPRLPNHDAKGFLPTVLVAPRKYEFSATMTFHQYDLKRVRLYTAVRLGFMSEEEDEKIRQKQGDGMIASGVFRDWEEIRCYKVIVDIVSMKGEEEEEEMYCGI
ncbi:hypothetical protein NMY22_g8049 [Coprinellus aureogranulatus]|nr:hypothetical protein NMY22_g8049 [Coprinellus aureogranulatus]